MHVGKPLSEVVKITAAGAAEIPAPVKVSVDFLVLRVCDRRHTPPSTAIHVMAWLQILGRLNA